MFSTIVAETKSDARNGSLADVEHVEAMKVRFFAVAPESGRSAYDHSRPRRRSATVGRSRLRCQLFRGNRDRNNDESSRVAA